eukprot:TRINITY_DN49768_c0_g1_i1.p1 TRINITY_DN49768_c0_g1~~TRINITY_DN49768_c0_g1_i1.p1  ORF type:complete len:547 (-),score=114.89 TRINITY_DN49768_c0_g1_i1:136-1776(-)
MGKTVAMKVMKAKRILKTGPAKKALTKGTEESRGSEGYYSGKYSPRETVVGKGFAKKALTTGKIVLEIEGHFLEISLKQRLRYKPEPTRFEPGSGYANRYKQWCGSTTLREALENGALPDDFYYDVKQGNLEWVPKLVSKKAKGPLPPSQWPPGIRALDGPPPFWLPADWAHGVKTTCKTFLKVFIAPNGKTYYHREVIEKIIQTQLGGLEGFKRHALERFKEGTDWMGARVKFTPDSKLFSVLSAREKTFLPSPKEFHFAVVSARRANKTSGIRGIVQVEAKLRAAGITPRWYVDADSLQDYKALGLDAVVGGKLTPARNKALDDAKKLGKACVQVSDDITSWQFIKSGKKALRSGEGASKNLKAANEAMKTVEKLDLSPLAAARFLLAKMRAARGNCEREGDGPMLGGIYPTGNAALAVMTDECNYDGFVLGDFFVHDTQSPVRFDETLTLKEDYDFTCSHLKKHGSVYRCHRLILHACHETNAGGACAIRDASGDKERQNVRVLQKKWPGVFKVNVKRGDTQVLMRWKNNKLGVTKKSKSKRG